MRVIVLAAGEGFQLDGFNKILIKDPSTGRRIMDYYIEAFQGKDITIVTGYRAINIMNEYPKLNYVYNANWRRTNNSYSLALTITEEPCYVISSDLFIDPELIRMMDDAEPNSILTYNTENRILSALNCVIEENVVKEIYQGAVRSLHDPEAIGIYKISDESIIREWKRKSTQYSNLFIGQNLPFEIDVPILSIDKGEYRVEEVNTPIDYINMIEH